MSESSSALRSILRGTFDVFITERFIQIVWWIGLGFAGLAFLGGLISGDGQAILAGLVTLTIGLLLFRIWCEMLVVVFRIANDLSAIRRLEEQKAPDGE